MFRRHRSDPEPAAVSALHDRLDAIAMNARLDSRAFDAGMVRGRLIGSATV
jgi:hypothetical protein